MRISVVVGLGFGDEGKGKTVSWLAKEHDPRKSLVIRFNGGHQAGHTVEQYEKRHVFSNFGSGSLVGLPTYFTKDCTICPSNLVKEYDILNEKGFRPTIIINPLCPVTTRFDIIANQVNNKDQNASCGVGFGTTLQREEDHYHLQFKDLAYPAIYEAKIKALAFYYGAKFVDTIGSRIASLTDEVINDIKDMKDRIGLPIRNELEIQQFHSEHIIFEGAQGILLDQTHGVFPFVTRSNTTSKNAMEFIHKHLHTTNNHITKYYITRPYQTRHGYGFMTNEDRPIDLVDNDKETNIHNDHQGKFRTGIIDLDLIQYAYESDYAEDPCPDHERNLVINCLDQITHHSKHLPYRSRNRGWSYLKDPIEIGRGLRRLTVIYGGYGPDSRSIKIIN